MKITLPFKTPTVNTLYWHKGNMKILSTSARKLREKIIEIVQGALLTNSFDDIYLEKLRVTVDIYEDWNYKKGGVAKKDVANREKFLVDSVFKGLDMDDKWIYEYVTRKIQSDEEKAEVTIERL